MPFFIFNRRNKSSSETLKNGDVIKVNRKFYYHYGVYVNKGKGKVIHYTGAEGPNDFKGKVRETSLKEFLNGACKVKVCLFPKELDNVDQLGRLPTTEVPIPCSQSVAPNLDSFERNSLKRLLRSLWEWSKKKRASGYHLYSGEETVRRARGELGKEEYNLVTNNCEHFAIWCKTGLKESSQINRLIDIILTEDARL